MDPQHAAYQFEQSAGSDDQRSLANLSVDPGEGDKMKAQRDRKDGQPQNAQTGCGLAGIRRAKK